MTEPVAKRVQVTGYTGVQAGVVKSPTDNAYLNTGAILGGEANYKGTFFRGQIEAGTALGAKLELGHTFDIGSNMGLEISAKTQMSKSLTSNNTYNVPNRTIHGLSIDYNNGETSVINVNTDAHSNYSTSWKGGETRTALGAKLTFGSNKAKFGIGIEGGYRKGNQPNMVYTMESNSDVDVTINGEKQIRNEHYTNCNAIITNSSFYATPTVSADIKLNKHLSFNANADLQQGNVGIRWNF